MRFKNFFIKNKGFLIVSVVFLLVALYMLPFRNQTYNDDYAYIQSVKNYLDSGIFKISDFSGAAFISQMWWGILFAKIFGFSIKILHLSVIILFYLGIVFFYLLLKRFNLKETNAVFFSLMLLTSPWVMQFAYTFQTDIPYISILIISLYFYVKAIQEKNNLHFLVGSVLAGVAFLIRQSATSLVVALLILLGYKFLAGRKERIKSYILGLAPISVFIVGYYIWASIPGNTTYDQYKYYSFVAMKKELLPYLIPFDLSVIESTNRLYARTIYRILFYLHHLVVFIAPLLLIFKFNSQKILNFFKEYKFGIFIIISLYFFFFGVSYFLHYIYGPLEFLDYPDRITSWAYLFPFNYISIFWKYLVVIGLGCFIPLIGFSIQNFIYAIISKRSPRSNFLFRKAFIFIVAIFLFFWVKSFLTIHWHTILFLPTYFEIERAFAYVQLLFSPVGLSFIYNSWLAIFILLTLASLAVNFLISLRLRDQQLIKDEVLFLSVAFFWHWLLIIIPDPLNVAQHLIALLPFILIWLACITRSWQISKTKAALVLIILLIFSVSITKNRYTHGGIVFELGNRLVTMKEAEPYQIFPHDWSWLPWWYGQQSFQEEVNKARGDKYKIKEYGALFYRYADYPVTISIAEVPLNFKKSDWPNREVVLDSGPQTFDIFRQIRYVAYRKK